MKLDLWRALDGAVKKAKSRIVRVARIELKSACADCATDLIAGERSNFPFVDVRVDSYESFIHFVCRCDRVSAAVRLGSRPVVRDRPRHAPAPPPTTVAVSYPIERDVTDYADFTGRTAAVHSVEVRARVDGYLDTVKFKEGALVKKGDVLFVIDPRPFVAELNRAKAQLEEAKANYTQVDGATQRSEGPAESSGRGSRLYTPAT